MSSKREVRIGTLADWLMTMSMTEFSPVLRDGVTQEEKRQQAIQIAQSHQDSYVSLLSELHSRELNITTEMIQMVLNNQHEYILCMWQDQTLLATAQASLMFPAMRSTVHISNVVVKNGYRGRGYGKPLLILLRRRARKLWEGKYGRLRFELTSRAERGTKEFYEGLGYVGTPTIRYAR